MRYLRFAALLGIYLFLASFANAQRVFVGVGAGPGYYSGPGYYGPAYLGPPPVCPFGFYGYYPYACAPYGYYGREWFVGRVFIGAGPWFHGFHGRGFSSLASRNGADSTATAFAAEGSRTRALSAEDLLAATDSMAEAGLPRRPRRAPLTARDSRSGPSDESGLANGLGISVRTFPYAQTPSSAGCGNCCVNQKEYGVEPFDW